MPWQQQVADVGLEVDEHGVPYYREVWVTVPRQNGKTTIVLVWEVDRCVNWGRPQQILYSAQDGWAGYKKLINDQAPQLEASKLKPLIKRVFRGSNQPAITWRTGSRIDVLGSSTTSGHGTTADLVVIDEAFADVDDRREQAAIPAMATRRHAQILGISTAGTEASVLLWRKVTTGRALVEADKRAGIAYFEWSAPDDADPDDPEAWWSCMPALGITITEDVVRHARQTMKDGEFRRAWMNQWTTADERTLPLEQWEAVCAGDHAVDENRVAYGLDATPERTHAAIAASDGDALELIDHRAGIGWAADRVVEIVERRPGPVGVDPAGPAGSLIAELERRGVEIVPVTGREMAHAAAGMYDAVLDATIEIRRHPSLDTAAAAVSRRFSGDSWVWARKGAAGDVCPIVAASIALHVAQSRDDGDGPHIW
jgi:hypothetical protein